jgi:hypothetical protein
MQRELPFSAGKSQRGLRTLQSANGEGVHGETTSTQFAAIAGIELNPSSNIAAVYGEQRGNGPGVYGIAKGRGGGVFGGSANGEGVHGETNSTQFAAVAGIELNPSSNIAAVYGERLFDSLDQNGVRFLWTMELTYLPAFSRLATAALFSAVGNAGGLIGAAVAAFIGSKVDVLNLGGGDTGPAQYQ